MRVRKVFSDGHRNNDLEPISTRQLSYAFGLMGAYEAAGNGVPG